MSSSESDVKAVSRPFCLKTFWSSTCVAIWRSLPSYSGPRKAKGATMAPALMPVTTRKVGRSPWAVHPQSRPAAKAPLLPPPLMARAAVGWPLTP